jgi:hypothetical protein
MRNFLIVCNIDADGEDSRVWVKSYSTGSIAHVGWDVVDHFGQPIARLGGQYGGTFFE